MATREYKTRSFTMRLKIPFHETLLKIQQKYHWSNRDLVEKLFENLQFLYTLMGDKFTLESGKTVNPLEKERIREIDYMVRL